MSDFPVTGVPPSFRLPGTFGEVLFAQGPSTASSSEYDVVFVMPKTSAGTWTVNTRYRVKTELDARLGGGVGSMIHRGIKRFLLANKTSAVYAVPYAATSGGSPAAATATVTWATDPTATGVTKVTVAGQVFSVAFVVGDTVTTIAAAMVAAVNAAEDLPCTAANASGVLTLTARIAGTSQGDGTTGVIRLRVEIDSGVGTTIASSGVALGLGAGADGAEGSTTEASNLAAALATLTAVRNYYIVFSDWDAEGIAAVKAHVALKSEAKAGLRSVAITGNTGALAACQTLATTANYERLRIALQIGSSWDAASLAGQLAAVYQKHESKDPATNFDGYAGPDWMVPNADLESNWPDADDQNDAINDGITIIASSPRGTSIAMSCTTRSKNAGGTVDDPRALESHRVAVGDKLMDNIVQAGALSFQGKKLRADVLKADGSIDFNAKYPPGVITPYRARGLFKSVSSRFEERAQIESAAYLMETLQTGVDPDNNGRLEATFNFNAINLLHQFTVRAAETNSG